MNAPERRVENPELRPVFEQAYMLIRPFFDENNSWSSGHGHEALAFRSLREHFPRLSTEQIYIIVSAAHMVFKSGRPITLA